MKRVSRDFFNIPISIEGGRVARQADGSVLVQYGDTIVLVAATAQREPKENLDFFPLTVDYREKLYAAGRIPGGFFKREGRPTDKETLTARLIDRPIRPLFPKGFQCETQVMATVLSVDTEHDPDLLALLGASAALSISDIPWAGPIAGVRVGRIEGELICNPTRSELAYSDMDIIVAGSRDGIVMVEGASDQVPHDVLLEALLFGHECMQPLIDMQEELVAAIGKPKREVPPKEIDEEFVEEVRSRCRAALPEVIAIRAKQPRQRAIEDLKKKLVQEFEEQHPDCKKAVSGVVEEELAAFIRGQIVSEQRRIDGRRLDEIRPVTCEVGLLPRTHGSALFTRGETQALVVTTLGTSTDEQRIEGFEEFFKSFMLHYNFPSYSVGEVRPVRGPGRREIGHGALAERALSSVLPDSESFPYTIRVVSDILESNGSSSMATVCGGTLSLMDAGVPIKAPVGGI
ncbi:MAG: polyribonucleotide nucleotidyltransferase, partial [Deltaproteobacteria bacterium]